MERNLRCTVAWCDAPATTSAGGYSFCRNHFISHCIGQLDGIAELFSPWRSHAPNELPEPARYTLAEIVSKASTLASREDLTALQRDQLLVILLRAPELRLTKSRASSGE